MNLRRVAAPLICSCIWPLPVICLAQQYEVHLINPGPGSDIICESITPNGDVVGYFVTYHGQSVYRAFVWRDDNFLLLPGGLSSSARGGNSSGAVVGTYSDGSTGHGALWQNGVLTDFGDLCGNPRAFPGQINEAGWIAGVISYGNPYPTQPFLYRNGQLIDSGAAGPVSITYGINSLGTVVGEFTDIEQSGHQAFAWIQGVGIVNIGHGAQAYDVNDAGKVVGHGFNSQTEQGFLWQYDTISWLNLTSASGINSSNDVVGYRRTGVGSQLDAYLLHDGNYIKLDDVVVNPMGLHSYGALDLTDSGIVLARMQTSDHQRYPWAVLTPVAELPTIWQFGFIVAALLTCRFWRHR